MNKLIIIGQGQHTDILYDIAKCMGYTEIEKVKYEDIEIGNNDYIIGIGDNRLREEISKKYKDLNYINLVHPNSYICEDTEIGIGNVICVGSIINPKVKLGNHNIINTKASVDHHTIIGNYNHIGPNATLCGTIVLENNIFIGASSTLIPTIAVCSNTLVGAGSLVLESIQKSGKYYGQPCKYRGLFST